MEYSLRSPMMAISSISYGPSFVLNRYRLDTSTRYIQPIYRNDISAQRDRQPSAPGDAIVSSRLAQSPRVDWPRSTAGEGGSTFTCHGFWSSGGTAPTGASSIP